MNSRAFLIIGIKYFGRVHLDVINLLNEDIDLEVSFILEIKDRGKVFEVVAYNHICHNHNTLTNDVVHKALEARVSLILRSFYLT